MRWLVVVVALVGVLVACGDVDGSSTIGAGGIPATLTGSGDGARADPDPTAPVAELAAGFNEGGSTCGGPYPSRTTLSSARPASDIRC